MTSEGIAECAHGFPRNSVCARFHLRELESFQGIRCFDLGHSFFNRDSFDKILKPGVQDSANCRYIRYQVAL